MKSFRQYAQELEEACWSGYKPVPGKKAYSKGSCQKEEFDFDVEVYELDESEDLEPTHLLEMEDENGELVFWIKDKYKGMTPKEIKEKLGGGGVS